MPGTTKPVVMASGKEGLSLSGKVALDCDILNVPCPACGAGATPPTWVLSLSGIRLWNQGADLWLPGGTQTFTGTAIAVPAPTYGACWYRVTEVIAQLQHYGPGGVFLGLLSLLAVLNLTAVGSPARTQCNITLLLQSGGGEPWAAWSGEDENAPEDGLSCNQGYTVIDTYKGGDGTVHAAAMM